ncbi:hypothetical protein [Kineococcus xinjiangensis]|uniref:hypothetical protein n=1 Tax=Kineococcus xinjiangensis TaxID=512762 RepID=UPI003CCBD291
MSWYGVQEAATGNVTMIPTAGRMDSTAFTDVLARLIDTCGEAFTLIVDNGPAHTSRHTRTWLDEHPGITVMHPRLTPPGSTPSSRSSGSSPAKSSSTAGSRTPPTATSTSRPGPSNATANTTPSTSRGSQPPDHELSHRTTSAARGSCGARRAPRPWAGCLRGCARRSSRE